MGGGDFVDLPHYGVDHEIGGVGFYHIGGGRGADNVGLIDLASEEGGLGGVRYEIGAWRRWSVSCGRLQLA